MLLTACSASADQRRDVFFERFTEHVSQTADLDDNARRIIVDALATRDEDGDDEALLTEALVLMSREFRAGLDAYDDEKYDDCLAALERIKQSPDLYIRHNARSYAVKALVHADRLLEAQERIETIAADLAEFRNYALDEAELQYLLGYCQVQNLQHFRARRTLEAFLRDYPEASPRFIVTAKQMLAELARRIPESIGEVADLMAFSEKRLAVGSADERLRQAQDQIIALLGKLIEQTEEAEKNQRSAGGASSRQQRQQRSRRSRTDKPLPDSLAPPGGPREGLKRPGRQVNPGEAWGSIPDAQRARILQVLRDRFPSRYRALLEQYYQSLAEQP